MGISFTPSAQSTVGIEWELGLVDTVTWQFTAQAEPIIAEAGGGEDQPIRKEFLQNMIELVSDPRQHVSEAVDDLRHRFETVQNVAEKHHVALLGAGTHPMSLARDQTPFQGERYDVVAERGAWWGQRMTMCGTHVHVGVNSYTKVMPIISGMLSLYPHMLALSAASPWWEGEDTGFVSQRTMIFQQLPTNTPGYPFETWARYEDYVAQLTATGMIDSHPEIRWDVRPAPKFGTVENRMFDSVPTFSELGALAAFTQCAVEYFSRELDAGRSVPANEAWFVKENKWRAARYGLEAEVIVPATPEMSDADRVRPLRTELAEWLHRLTPISEQLGCGNELEFCRTLLAQGPSYVRQRALGADPLAVTRAIVAETGREHPEYSPAVS